LAFFGASIEASFLADHLCSSLRYKGKKSRAFQKKWLRGLRQVKVLKGERVEELKRREKPLVPRRPEGGHSVSRRNLPMTKRKHNLTAMSELVFEVIQEADGGYCAECLTDSIVTEGDTWEELRKNVREVVRAFYFDEPEKLPSRIRLHLVRDEVFAYA
jgi:hypothetical protein